MKRRVPRLLWGYWSSTEYNSTSAWYFASSGYMSFVNKTTASYVRCVRRY